MKCSNCGGEVRVEGGVILPYGCAVDFGPAPSAELDPLTAEIVDALGRNIALTYARLERAAEGN